MVNGIITRDGPVSYWPILPLSLVTLPEVFAKVIRPSFPLVFKVANWSRREIDANSLTAKFLLNRTVDVGTWL